MQITQITTTTMVAKPKLPPAGSVWMKMPLLTSVSPAFSQPDRPTRRDVEGAATKNLGWVVLLEPFLPRESL